MSRKEMILAASMMAAGLARSAEQDDLFDNSSLEEDGRFQSHLNRFASVAAAMLEAAFNVTFSYPENYAMDIYWNAGYNFADATSWDGDRFDHPDDEWFLDKLEDFMLNQFNTVASESQKATLRNVVAQARATYIAP